MAESERFNAGLKNRKEVLGEEYVNNSINNANDFTWPFQQMVTEACWGDCWGRPGLERKTRSMLNLAMLCCLNRPHEFKVHVRGAINNGVTPEEIQEILLQVGVYAGVPASLEGFKNANEVLKEMGVVK